MPILNWLDRNTDVKVAESVPYKLLEVDPDLSYGDPDTENMLIQGDNLEALKALLLNRPEYRRLLRALRAFPLSYFLSTYLSAEQGSHEIQRGYPSKNPDHPSPDEAGLSVSLAQGPELGSGHQHIPRAVRTSDHPNQPRH